MSYSSNRLSLPRGRKRERGSSRCHCDNVLVAMQAQRPILELAQVHTQFCSSKSKIVCPVHQRGPLGCWVGSKGSSSTCGPCVLGSKIQQRRQGGLDPEIHPLPRSCSLYIHVFVCAFADRIRITVWYGAVVTYAKRTRKLNCCLIFCQ